MMITVLRLGHRHFRDQRISTHVALTARALGADGIIYSGEQDESMMDSVKDVADRWGGTFAVSYEKNWKKVIKDFKGVRVHLTAYGERIQDKIKDLRVMTKGKDVLIIVGGEKVPAEVYHTVEMNIAIGNQPHSEVAATAIFLHELMEGKGLEKEFPNAKVSLEPNPRGKTIKGR